MTHHIRRTAQAAVIAGAALVSLLAAGTASADPTPAPQPAECTNGRACASAPGCPDQAVQLPAGPHAESAPAPAATTCTTLNVAPRRPPSPSLAHRGKEDPTCE